MQAFVIVVQLAADRATAIKRCFLYATIIASALGSMSCIITHIAAAFKEVCRQPLREHLDAALAQSLHAANGSHHIHQSLAIEMALAQLRFWLADAHELALLPCQPVYMYM